MESIRTRRGVLKAAGSLISLAALPVPALARLRDVRELSFHHTHTSEKLDIVYVEGGAYVPEALSAIDYLLRDFRSGDVHAIDPRLLDLLFTVRTRTGGSRPFEVISGFRSPLTNEMLREKSNGVARNSMHLRGQAIDVRLPGVDTLELRRAAVALRRGGVGYYPDSDFVHLDTGRVRTW